MTRKLTKFRVLGEVSEESILSLETTESPYNAT